ncbi:MAG TPA: prolipoprotein diacylglyceryl transferase [Thermodesulfobacteriota bacterium]|nr:prolipoprotein diacylglyceryl transferase [Thermodesulfobacteriota bacterium]
MHPILFDFGLIQIRFYGIMYVVGIIAGAYLIRSEVKRKEISLTNDDVANFIMWVAIAGIIGARLYYVIFNWDYYATDPFEIPAIWHGGLAIHGGLIGGILAAWAYVRKKRVPFFRMSDAAAPALILAQAFGRFGNFMNGDAHGTPTNLPWGMVFPAESMAGIEFPGIPIHPVMLYEMLINLSIFSFLWFVLRKRGHKDGFVFAMYFLLYSGGRFFVEFFRADSLMLGSLRAAQIMSLVLMGAAIIFIFKKSLWKRP